MKPELTASEQAFEEYYEKLGERIEPLFRKRSLRSRLVEGYQYEAQELFLDLLIDQNGLLHMREGEIDDLIKANPNLINVLIEALAEYNESPIPPPEGYLKEGDLIAYRLGLDFWEI